MTTYGDLFESAMVTQLKVELAERDWEQKDLAEKISVNRVTMSNYMTGKRSIPMPTFLKIAEALGIAPGTLMDRADARVRPTTDAE
ncbi:MULTISPECIES: helix-turn-helix transcriptional regulator [Arthrobacter]|uniref:XRE family transcriptional regulator n=1 Tax=Arthrobacter terricola TaxID=2547396 RepID=A0A4R5K716_9MICC|nr:MULTISPECIES: helix-turn-helix transcriptional regulator [Arthrobacter]MBT8163087.1 helix-turn-helix domain-containing protein [Arthrobacter sp. GN70]TDF88127.1 XRE family transcriptional regulator [Arthrobacter terricola]